MRNRHLAGRNFVLARANKAQLAVAQASPSPIAHANRRTEDAAGHGPPGVHIAVAGCGIQRRAGRARWQNPQSARALAPESPSARWPDRRGTPPHVQRSRPARAAQSLPPEPAPIARQVPCLPAAEAYPKALKAKAPWQHCVQPSLQTSHLPALFAASANAVSMICTSRESPAGQTHIAQNNRIVHIECESNSSAKFCVTRLEVSPCLNSAAPSSPAIATATPLPPSTGSAKVFGFERHAVHEGANGTILPRRTHPGQRHDHARLRQGRRGSPQLQVAR